MINLNKTFFFGRATRDAEVKSVGESQVAVMRLVSNRRIKKRSGEYEEKATFVDVETWGQRAEFAGQNVKKGVPVFVVGRLESDEWTTAEGQRRSKLKIYANELQVDTSARERAEVSVGQTSGSEDLPF